MNHSSYFMSQITDTVVWEHLQRLLQEYNPEFLEKHNNYRLALDGLTDAGGNAQALDQAYRSIIISDAVFAFNKGLEANLYHFWHPCAPSFTQVDFENMYQEYAMMAMPKREVAEKIISEIEAEYFQAELLWCKTIKECIIDLEVITPKIMHFEGYKAGNTWFRWTVPGYQEDQALTSIYQIQINHYFGN